LLILPADVAFATLANLRHILVITLKYNIGHITDKHNILKRNSAIVDKPRDAFRGQSRSPNIVPFHILGMVSYSNFVRKTRRFF